MNRKVYFLLFFLEALLVVALLLLFPAATVAEIGNPNATVITLLTVGNSLPEILNVSIDDDAASITLNPNATKQVVCAAVLEDFNGDTDINASFAELYGNVSSFPGDSDDFNYHYTNSSCFINSSFGSYNGYTDDAFRSLANCTFQVEYYAFPEEWICNVTVNDSAGTEDMAYDNISMGQLLAIGTPDNIDYGTVNATLVSNENQTNITNLGNVAINLSLEGYAQAQGDGNAMNCTLGSIGNISIEHEKYNLTTSNPGTLTLAQVNANYTNLTTNAQIRFLNLSVRENDVTNDIVQPTYWRLYVPIGVAGNCTGNIIFGATAAPAT